jgi:uncharacterized membrane protein
MKEQYKFKKRLIHFAFIFLILFLIYKIVENNYDFYEKPIGKIIKAEEVKKDDKKFRQNFEIILLNTEKEGKTIKSYSEYTLRDRDYAKFSVGEEVFLNKLEDSKEGYVYKVLDVKRDKYIAVLVSFFVLILLYITGKRGFLTLLSVAFNILVFIFLLKLFADGRDIENYLNLFTAVFASITLFIIGDRRIKTISSIISTVISVFLMIIIFDILYSFTDDLSFEMMEYISGPDDIFIIFKAGIITGCLGAVMDIAVTVNAAVYEIINKSEKTDFKKLIHSIKEIGYDVTGTMINVLFFTFVSGTIPMIIMRLSNGYTAYSILKYYLVFDIIRFLMGAIGIVIAIPIAGVVSLAFSYRKVVKKNVN